MAHSNGGKNYPERKNKKLRVEKPEDAKKQSNYKKELALASTSKNKVKPKKAQGRVVDMPNLSPYRTAIIAMKASGT